MVNGCCLDILLNVIFCLHSLRERQTHGWLEWPHYYLDYYLYSYATCFSASIQIAKNILTEGKPTVKRFMQFLESGSSDYPLNVLKKASVDMTTPEPIEAVAARMNELMDDMVKILNEKEHVLH